MHHIFWYPPKDGDTHGYTQGVLYDIPSEYRLDYSINHFCSIKYLSIEDNANQETRRESSEGGWVDVLSGVLQEL